MGSALSELPLGEIAKPGLMHTKRLQQLLPFTPLLLLPLLLWKFFDASQQSLIAWDEGLYMLRARLFLDQNEAWVPFAQAHHKTPGHYWIVALSMRLFGVSDSAARLPFVLLALLSAWIVYEIGSLILSRRAGALASLVLGTSYLWAVHSRTISPDLAYTSFFLGGVLLLVQELAKPIESSGQFCRCRLYFAGALFALTIVLRSALAFLPLVGLMPWLLKQARGRKILRSSWLWLGLACGALPMLIWVWKSIVAYGITGFIEPLKFPLRKAAQTGFPLSGFPFYFSSVFLNFIPWSPLLPFAVTSPSLWRNQQDTKTHHQSMIHRRWLLLAVPTTMLLLLAFTSSDQNNYALPIYPFASLLVAADLEHRLVEAHTANGFYEKNSRMRWRSLQSIATVYCCLASIVLVFCFGGGLPRISGQSDTTLDMEKLGLLLVLVSTVWFLGGLMVYWHHRSLQQSLKSWLTLHLLGVWLAIFGTVHLGFVGNYSPEVKALLKQPHLQDALSTAPADLVKVDGKIATLLRAYSPIMGRSWSSFEEFKAQGSGLAWIRASDVAGLNFPHRRLAQSHGVLLIQKTPAPTPW